MDTLQSRRITVQMSAKISERDEAVLYSVLRSFVKSASAEAEVFKSPMFEFNDADGVRHNAELCDALIVTDTEVIMFELKTRCSHSESLNWMRIKPVEARKQSYLAAQAYIDHDGFLLDASDTPEILANKTWKHVTVLNSVQPDTLKFVKDESRNIRNQKSLEFFEKVKVVTLDEIKNFISLASSVDSLFGMPSVMDA